MTTEVRDYWDAQAASFDDEPDHGLRDPGVRAAWADLLLPLVPPGSRVADLGSGTGSLSMLLAGAGHHVTGVDLAPRMVAAARAKAAPAGPVFVVGDAGAPPLPEGAFDVVLVRHVLWALPDPSDAVRRWVRLLAAGGRLVLVEGRWWTGGGLPAERTRELVLGHRAQAEVVPLTDPALWGGPIEDERYLVLSTR